MDNIYIDVIDNTEITPWYRYLQLNKNGVVQGILLSTNYEPANPDNMFIHGEQDGLAYVSDNYEPLLYINPGWRIDEQGHWHEPDPATEQEILEKEIRDIAGELSVFTAREQQVIQAQNMGIELDSPEGRALFPEPVYNPPEPPEQDPCLAVSFAKLGGIWTEELKRELTPIMPMKAKMASRIKLSKEQLLESLREKSARLEMINSGN